MGRFNLFKNVNLKLVLNFIVVLSSTSSFAFGAKKPSEPGNPGNGNPGEQNPQDPIARKYAFVDKGRIIRREHLEKLLTYYDRNKASLKNSRYISLIDFALYSGKKRFYVVDMNSGNVTSYHTSHGLGSDLDHTGYAETFSNVEGSKKTALGFYMTAETYMGDHGYSLRLDGMSSTNSNARERAVVIHPADYVDPSWSKMGRSWGCPALSPEVSRSVIERIKGGSLIYAFK